MGIDQMLSSISRSAMRYPNEAAERHQGVIQPRTTMGVHGGESYERSPPVSSCRGVTREALSPQDVKEHSFPCARQ